MSKTVAAGMETHLLQEVTTLANCWRVTRTDGVEFFFTDHDVNIPFDGNTYIAETGYNRTSVQNDSTLAVDNLDVQGILDSTQIKETELRAGLFDFAQIRIFIVNWDNLSNGDVKMRNGRLGEVTMSAQGIFSAELRGLSQALSQQIGEVYQPECRADLGDTACKVPIDPAVVLRSTLYAVGDFVKVSTAAGTTQEQYENRIYECTRAGITDGVQPTYDTVVGNTTLDGDEFASGILTFTGNAGNNETVTIDTKVYTFQTTLTDVDGNVLIGATASDSIDNLVAAITLGAGGGSLYAASTTLHPTVTAAAGAGDTMDATAKTAGDAGNDISTSETLVSGFWGAPNLESGVTGAIFTAREAWTRHAVVDTVTDNKLFTLTVAFDEARDVDGWFDGGAMEFEDGENNGKIIEIRDWVQSTRQINMFLSTAFAIAVGAKVRLYPGCDKRLTTCINKFVMPGSTNFANGNVKNFRGEPHVPGQDELIRYPDAKA